MKLYIIILTFILIVSCNSADEIFVFYKTDLISKSICKNNKIKNRIDILHNLVSNKRDTIRLLEFDKKGNLTEISINAGKLKYYYNDTILIKQEEYNYGVIKGVLNYYHSNKVSIDSCFFTYEGRENELYATIEHYKDNMNRDTLTITKSYGKLSNQEKLNYDEFGLKSVYEVKDKESYIKKKITISKNKKEIYHFLGYDNDTTKFEQKEIIKLNTDGFMVEYKNEGNILDEHKINYKKEYNNNVPIKDTYFQKGKPVYSILYSYKYFEN